MVILRKKFAKGSWCVAIWVLLLEALAEQNKLQAI
jgi:hypothetical protein